MCDQRILAPIAVQCPPSAFMMNLPPLPPQPASSSLVREGRREGGREGESKRERERGEGGREGEKEN